MKQVLIYMTPPQKNEQKLPKCDENRRHKGKTLLLIFLLKRKKSIVKLKNKYINNRPTTTTIKVRVRENDIYFILFSILKQLLQATVEKLRSKLQFFNAFNKEKIA